MEKGTQEGVRGYQKMFKEVLITSVVDVPGLKALEHAVKKLGGQDKKLFKLKVAVNVEDKTFMQVWSSFW